MDPILTWSASIIAVGGAATVIWKIFAPLITRVRKMMDSIENFMRDWSGEEARPGHDEVPGVMERLQKIESELKHNGGTSIKDAVKRIENKLTKIDERLEEGNRRFQEIEDELHG
jgi:biopolymer transport protein ExbB/TolQ